MRNRITEEEKVAKKLADIIANVSLDLDLVGVYLARAFPNVVYRRLEIIQSSAEYEKEQDVIRRTHDPLF